MSLQFDCPGRFAFEIVLGWLRARRAKARRGEKWRGAMRRALALKDLRQRRIGGGTFVELSRGKTHYHLSGPEDGPLVVLCHGFGVFSYVYSDLADVAARNELQLALALEEMRALAARCGEATRQLGEGAERQVELEAEGTRQKMRAGKVFC